jgi:hypothetical protein
MKTIRRIECFLALVWRYPTGPNRDESPEWFRANCRRIDIRLAWQLARDLNP